MKQKNIYLVVYDISDNKKRNRVAKLLQQFGYERIQLSVFTGNIKPAKFELLWKKLEKAADADNFPDNKLFCFAVTENAIRQMQKIGTFTLDVDYILGNKKTIIF